jgi:DNA polymerase III alpha subunit
MDLSNYNLGFTLCSHNSDFDPNHAEEVFNYIVTTFGRDNVSNIGTYGMLKTKSAIQDMARVFSVPASETLGVTKNIDIESEADDIADHEAGNPELTKFLNKNKTVNNKDLRFFIEGVRGSARNLSMHAAGVLISDRNLRENIALMKCKKGIITAWQESGAIQELESIGYAKVDILKLQQLPVLDETVKLIKQNKNQDIDLDAINLEDKQVYDKIIRTGDQTGIFQFEADFVIKMIQNIMPRNFEQYAAISSLLRPGPLHMGMDKEFANRLNGIPYDIKDKNNKIVEQDHIWTEEEIPESIRSILSSTNGVLCIVGDSMVITEEGLLSIETIVNEQLNLNVLTFNEITKSLEWQNINKYYNNGLKNVIELDFGITKIQCTENQEIYTENRGWVEAQNITEDDEILFENNLNL